MKVGVSMKVREVINSWCTFMNSCSNGCNGCENKFGPKKVPCIHKVENGVSYYGNIKSIMEAERVLSLQ